MQNINPAVNDPYVWFFLVSGRHQAYRFELGDEGAEGNFPDVG